MNVIFDFYVDLGASWLRVYSSSGELLLRERVTTYSETLSRCARNLSVRGSVGVAVAGEVRGSRVFHHTAAPEGVEIPRFFEGAERVFVVNDAVACAYSLLRRKRVSPVFAFVVGTGLGGGLAVEGFHFNFPLEIGHTILELKGPRCRCGRRGCAELWASGRGVEERYRELAGEEVESREVWREWRTDPVKFTVVDGFLWTLAAVYVNAVTLFAPRAVGFFGGVAESLKNAVSDLRWRVEELGGEWRGAEFPSGPACFAEGIDYLWEVRK